MGGLSRALTKSPILMYDLGQVPQFKWFPGSDKQLGLSRNSLECDAGPGRQCAVHLGIDQVTRGCRQGHVQWGSGLHRGVLGQTPAEHHPSDQPHARGLACALWRSGSHLSSGARAIRNSQKASISIRDGGVKESTAGS